MPRERMEQRLTWLGVSEEKDKWRARYQKYLCSCGNVKYLMKGNVDSGRTRSCGCLVGHGLAGTPEHVSWAAMRSRCNRSSHVHYRSYGGRGITVCAEWDKSFKQFLSDMGRKPTKNHSIDRIDENGNYEPSNCRWATPKDQANNRRNNVYLTIGDKTTTRSIWSDISGTKYSTIHERQRRGWSDEEAVYGRAKNA